MNLKIWQITCEDRGMGLSKDGKVLLYIIAFLTIFGIIIVLGSSWPTAVSEHRTWYYYELRQGTFALPGFASMQFAGIYDNGSYEKNIL